MEILGPELPLRDFGSPLDVDGAALAIPGTECMEGSGHCSKPAAGRCSPLLVSLPLHNTAGANHYLVSQGRLFRSTAVLHIVLPDCAPVDLVMPPTSRWYCICIV